MVLNHNILILKLLSFVGSFLLFLLTSCSTLKYVPVTSTSDVSTVQIDTVIIKDSIWLTPKTIIKEIVPALDTLVMESDIASAKAYLDTTFRALRGELISKPSKTEKKEKEKIQIQKDTVYVSKEIPVPVEVIKYKIPQWCWICLGVIIIEILVFILSIIYKKR